ncbi:cell filamentation protein Fic [Cellulomonas marina]|uniref:Fido domain-containing protein n=1 Tax=Cellulomonas marina TaxID=988821 RepID=A0A1I0XHR4_9CELL|nr:cell filamentation protein Fic [Cellulomonas marina]SFA99778.1 hypothetical protein SAMN05421867_10523 [Cellulomonas marina]
MPDEDRPPPPATPLPAGDPLAGLAALPAVVAAVGRAREACEALRWHEAYRRRWREVRAECTLRAARAGAALEGARVPLDLLRAAALTPDEGRPDEGRPDEPQPDEGRPDASRAGVGRADAALVVARGVFRADALVADLLPPLGGPGAPALPALPPTAQLLARLHAAVVGGPGGRADAGRLRAAAEVPLDLRGLGPAPAAADAAARVALLGQVLAATRAPALVVAAVAHAELLVVRPFAVGSGPVARAFARLLVVRGGLDPTGTVLAEEVWAAAPQTYLAGTAQLATGTPDGAARWVALYADAVVDGARRARDVADGVLAGRMPGIVAR